MWRDGAPCSDIATMSDVAPSQRHVSVEDDILVQASTRKAKRPPCKLTPGGGDEGLGEVTKQEILGSSHSAGGDENDEEEEEEDILVAVSTSS